MFNHRENENQLSLECKRLVIKLSLLYQHRKYQQSCQVDLAQKLSQMQKFNNKSITVTFMFNHRENQWTMRFVNLLCADRTVSQKLTTSATRESPSFSLPIFTLQSVANNSHTQRNSCRSLCVLRNPHSTLALFSLIFKRSPLVAMKEKPQTMSCSRTSRDDRSIHKWLNTN